ncbi:MAG: carboxylating nicotinate-nucleotide diphosphorylase [Halioglobus sp.]|nr:carboxylating nicotinate-nucleotide diphosphorylase [Halioglobus sp.]
MTLQAAIETNVRAALAEDLGSGDITAALVPPGSIANARIIAREEMILAGRRWAEHVFRSLDVEVHIDWQAADGDRLVAGAELCTLHGQARALLGGERTALNFLQTLSATATTTARYVAAVAHTGARILDTRKTIPGLRLAQKYAVVCGGGTNHRIGLFDAILVKENHISGAGSIKKAVERARAINPDVLLEVEVETLAQLDEALGAGVRRILLDNFSPDELRAAVKRNRADGKNVAELEASGGLTFEDLTAVAETGVDYISVGALTKHVRAIDLSMRFD